MKKKLFCFSFLTIALLIFAKNSIAQGAPPSKEKDENKTTKYIDLGDFEGKPDKQETKTSDLLDFSAFEGKTTNEMSTFTDSRDGKIYKTIKIGTQTWMAENLAYKASGDCWAYDDDNSNVNKYGYLYSWDNAKASCPAGWHLPNDSEWTILINFLGGESIAGGKLKETSTTHWRSPNTSAGNDFGFTALPGGFHEEFGAWGGEAGFEGIGDKGFWWSSTWHITFGVSFLSIKYNDSVVTRDTYGTNGLSVRCIKD